MASENPPWQIVQYSDNGAPKYDGLTFDIIQHLSEKLNFTYKVLVASTNGVSKPINSTPKADGSKKMAAKGSQVESGMPEGQKTPEAIVELIKNKKVFFAACAYTVDESKKSVINYTLPISVQTYTLLAPKPRPLSRALLFISPFTNGTWACLASAIIIIGPILYLVHKFSPKPITGIQEAVGLNTPDQCVWYIYGALLQQGGMNLPRADSARLIVGTWWLVVMVLVATYSGSLVTFLTFPKIDDSVSTIDDLLDRASEFTWGFPNGSFLEEYLQTTEESKLQELLSKAERHKSTIDHNVVIRVREGNHILIDWKSSLTFLMQRDLLDSGRCHFSLSSDEFISEPIAMMIGQGSPYLKMIDAELERMHETGLIKKWTLERMPMKDECWEGPGNNQETDNHKVNMSDMQGIFFVLAIGFTIAAIVISCEFGWHKKQEAYERKLIRPFVS